MSAPQPVAGRPAGRVPLARFSDHETSLPPRARVRTATSLKRKRSSQAAAGGSLAARELWFDRIWLRSRLASTLGLVTHVCGRISFGSSARSEAWLARVELLFRDFPFLFPGMVLIPSPTV